MMRQFPINYTLYYCYYTVIFLYTVQYTIPVYNCSKYSNTISQCHYGHQTSYILYTLQIIQLIICMYNVHYTETGVGAKNLCFAKNFLAPFQKYSIQLLRRFLSILKVFLGYFGNYRAKQWPLPQSPPLIYPWTERGQDVTREVCPNFGHPALTSDTLP